MRDFQIIFSKYATNSMNIFFDKYNISSNQLFFSENDFFEILDKMDLNKHFLFVFNSSILDISPCTLCNLMEIENSIYILPINGKFGFKYCIIYIFVEKNNKLVNYFKETYLQNENDLSFSDKQIEIFKKFNIQIQNYINDDFFTFNSEKIKDLKKFLYDYNCVIASK